MFNLPYDEGLELIQEGIREQSKDELYQLWLQRHENPMSDKKNYVEWGKFLDKHLPKQNKSLPTSKKTDEELFEQASLIIEKMKRSKE